MLLSIEMLLFNLCRLPTCHLLETCWRHVQFMLFTTYSHEWIIINERADNRGDDFIQLSYMHAFLYPSWNVSSHWLFSLLWTAQGCSGHSYHADLYLWPRLCPKYWAGLLDGLPWSSDWCDWTRLSDFLRLGCQDFFVPLYVLLFTFIPFFLPSSPLSSILLFPCASVRENTRAWVSHFL